MLSPNIHKGPRCTHFILSFEPLHRSGHPRCKLRQVGRRGRCARTATVFSREEKLPQSTLLLVLYCLVKARKRWPSNPGSVVPH